MVDGFGACRAKHMVSLGTGVLVPHVVAAVRRRYAIESTPLSVSDQHASPVMCSVHHQAFLHVLQPVEDGAKVVETALDHVEDHGVVINHPGIPRIKHEGLQAENEALQHRLGSQEEEFRLQNQTLMDELTKVVAASEELEKKNAELSKRLTGEGGGSDGSPELQDEVRRLRAENTALQKKIEVNDLGGSFTGEGASSRPANLVIKEIKAKGGKAVANYEPVEDGAKVVETALDHVEDHGVVINHPGIPRNKPFARISDTDWGTRFPWITKEEGDYYAKKVGDYGFQIHEKGHGKFMARRYSPQVLLLQLTTEIVKLLNIKTVQDSFTGPVPGEIFAKISTKHGYDCNRIAKELHEIFQLIGIKSASLSYCKEKNHLSVSIRFKCLNTTGADYGIVHIDAGCHMQPFIIFEKEERQIKNGLGKKFHIKLRFECATTYIDYFDHMVPDKVKRTVSELLTESEGNKIFESLQNTHDWSIDRIGEAKSLYCKSEIGEVILSMQVEINKKNNHYLGKHVNQDKKKNKGRSKPQNLYFNIKAKAIFHLLLLDEEPLKYSLKFPNEDGGITYEEIKSKIDEILEVVRKDPLDKIGKEDEETHKFILSYSKNERLTGFLCFEDFIACLLYYCEKYNEKWINQLEERGE
ncbi:HSD17B4 [Branchiostoma lanceolatum]|uniref:HSD17B4 protein n=1 Tax=Branchiostoma lanceolatum TaxID=7740 RepID=A0A8J9ZJP5_BRALA|nr:HSD17B4 [Branchiostoma lanceolatum]